MDEETEIQKREVTCPRPHSQNLKHNWDLNPICLTPGFPHWTKEPAEKPLVYVKRTALSLHPSERDFLASCPALWRLAPVPCARTLTAWTFRTIWTGALFLSHVRGLGNAYPGPTP